MMQIENLMGEKDKLAGNIANELIHDMQLSTGYPPSERDYIGAGELTELVDGLSRRIVEQREHAKLNSED